MVVLGRRVFSGRHSTRSALQAGNVSYGRPGVQLHRQRHRLGLHGEARINKRIVYQLGGTRLLARAALSTLAAAVHTLAGALPRAHGLFPRPVIAPVACGAIAAAHG